MNDAVAEEEPLRIYGKTIKWWEMTNQGMGWERVDCVIYKHFGKEPWYYDVASYLFQRYNSIETRLMETFRYVSCHPKNKLKIRIHSHMNMQAS